MTTLHFSGKSFIGAGLLCREPGDYTVSDSTAERLVRDHAHLFSLADEQPEAPQAPETDEDPSTEDVPGGGELEDPKSDSTPETGEVAEAGTGVETTEATHTTDETAGSTELSDESTEKTEINATADPDVETKAKPVSKMNKTELEALAAEVGVEVNSEMTADEMRQTIKAAQAE